MSTALKYQNPTRQQQCLGNGNIVESSAHGLGLVLFKSVKFWCRISRFCIEVRYPALMCIFAEFSSNDQSRRGVLGWSDSYDGCCDGTPVL